MIIGIDEAGRGAWAGPLLVAAVSIGKNKILAGLNDSKKLNANQREKLRVLIKENYTYSLGEASSIEVDHYGLTIATNIAIRRSLARFKISDVEEIIIDGNFNYLKGSVFEYLTKTIVKADNLIPEVMAASILAKTERDEIMRSISREYPVYGFDKHVGYGTELHREALISFGVCPSHRQSYTPVKGYL